MNLLFHFQKHKSLFALQKHTSFKYKSTHYDVLKLKPNCTTKDIKQSFIKLSKENHPDVNKSKDANKKFQAINESYKVLSNPQSRRNYDLGLIPQEHTRGPQVYNSGGWNDPSFYANRDKSKDKYYKSKPYYGIKNQEKLPNLVVVSICLSIAALIVGLQFLAIAKSRTFRRQALIQKSEEAQQDLNILKKNAEINGNQLQIEILKLKFDERDKSNKKI